MHDDVIKWKHFPRYWPFVREIRRPPANFPHKGQWRGVLMFSLICAWINGWVNNREAGDLRHHRAHYDVTLMPRHELHGPPTTGIVIGFNHGLPWCVKYMARGPPVTTKPDGEAGGFCGDRRPEGHVFHTSRQAMIKTYYSTSIRKNMVQNCSYFTQMKSTTTAIDDSNRNNHYVVDIW